MLVGTPVARTAHMARFVAVVHSFLGGNGDIENCPAAGFQDPEQLRHRDDVVRYVLQDVAAVHGVKGGIGIGDRHQVESLVDISSDQVRGRVFALGQSTQAWLEARFRCDVQQRPTGCGPGGTGQKQEGQPVALPGRTVRTHRVRPPRPLAARGPEAAERPVAHGTMHGIAGPGDRCCQAAPAA